MWRMVFIYAALVAAAVLVMEWAQYQVVARRFGLEIFIGIVAVMFAALGVWLGYHLTRRPAAPAFEVNSKALSSLGITRRELDVLNALTAGGSNKDIARAMGVSPNTVKSHIASLYSKLDVSSRVLAIEKARFLSLIPPASS